MRKVYSYLGAFLLLSFGLNAQNYTADEMLEIQAHQQSLVDLSISNPFQPTFSAPTFGTDSTMADWIPTAGATETFAPAVGDFFFDPGGPGGGPDETPGNYPNCGCATQTTLENVSQIKIHDMDIFANFDYLRIYDGTDTSGTLLFGNGPGDPNDGDYSLPAGTVLDADSGNFFFYFHASTVVNRLGWEIEIMEADGTTEPDPEPEDCSQGIPSFADVPNAVNITIGNDFMNADDFIVDEGVLFTLNQITLDTNQQEVPDEVIIYIHEDDNGFPGAIIETINTVPDSSDQVGEAFGDPIYHLVFNLDTPIEFQEGRYWINSKMSTPSNEVVWLAVTDEASHELTLRRSQDGGDTWTADASGYNAIMTVSGLCEDDDGSTEPGDDYDCTVEYEGSHENALGNLQLLLYANDFVVANGVTMSVESLTVDIIADYTDATTLAIYENNGGQPGAVIESFSNVAPTSKTLVGSAFGFNIYESVFDFPTAVELEAGTYWVGLQVSTGSEGTSGYWATSDTFHGNLPYYSNDGGTTWTQSTLGEDCAFIISGTCTGEAEPEPEPEDPCDDKVIMECGVEYTADLVPNAGHWANYTGVTWTYNGSEQVFEFTADMTGDYEFILDQGAADADFMVMDACSNTANNLIGGYWTGLVNQTLFLNEGDTIYIIADLFSSSTPSTVSIQVNCPTEPFELTCQDNFAVSNNFENGSFFGGTNNQHLAIDVHVGDEGFTVYGMDMNIFIDASTDIDFYFTIYEDDNGLPGAVFNDNGYGQVISNEYLGNAFNFDVYNFVVKFDSSVDLEPNTVYWIEVETEGVAWESTSAGAFGATAAFKHDGTGGAWTLATNEMVYSLVCEQLGVSDLSSFDFAYYPNPVRDVLNITSQKAVQSVEVYNLTGQRVMSESMVNQSQIDVSKLTTGTYVFRVTLEDGQVETFKIIKKGN